MNKFNRKQYTQDFIDAADNDDLQSFIEQDLDESIRIEAESLPNLNKDELIELVTYMKRKAKNVLQSQD